MHAETVRGGAGIRFIDPGFNKLGLHALKVLLACPTGFKEALLFRSSPVCFFLQKILNWSLGGQKMLVSEITEGPLKGFQFEFSSTEKYFMLGPGFELAVQDAVTKAIAEGDVIYDVGANVGFMSLLFSALCGANGQVIAFEPSPVNFARLKGHVEGNRLSNIIVDNRAVSDREAFAILVENGSQSHIVEFCVDESCSTVKTVRLDDLIARRDYQPPAFVKIDVEGHAGSVLGGMAVTLMEIRPRLFLEIHDTKEESEVLSILSKNSYVIQATDLVRGFPKRVMAFPQDLREGRVHPIRTRDKCPQENAKSGH